MKSGWEPATVRQWVKVHKAFSVLLLCQLVVLLCLTAGLFRAESVAEVLPQNFAESAAKNSSDYPDEYVAQLAEDGLQVQVAWDIKYSESDETAQLATLFSVPVALRSGAYEMVIEYWTDSATADKIAAQVTLEEERFEELVYGDAVLLKGGDYAVEGRVWVPLGANASQVVVQVTPQGECDFTIQRIVLHEQRIYRVVRLLACLLFFAIVDAVGYCLFARDGAGGRAFCKKHSVAFALALVCILACLPFFGDGLLRGDDIAFHLTRIIQVAYSMKAGQFPVRLYTDALNGFGYASPLYYCDLFLYLPAILYNCMVPLQLCYKIYGVVVTSLTCVFCYQGLKHLNLSVRAAAAGTTIYLLAGYRLVNVFLRFAVGEYTAMMWLPLVVWGIYAIYTRSKISWRDWLPLAIGMAGIVQCHVISFELVCLFLVFFCVLAAKKTFKRETFLALTKAAFVALGLSLWFLVPMFWSMATQDIEVTKRLMKDFQTNGASLYQILGLFSGQKGANSLGTLGASMVLGALLAIMVLLYQDHWGKQAPERKILLQSALMMSGICVLFAWRLFPWNSLLSRVEGTFLHKLLALPQFPWRYLTIATMLLSIAAAVSLDVLWEWKPVVCKSVLAGLVSVAVLYTALFGYNLYQVRSQTTLYADIPQGWNSIGASEYLLPGTVDRNRVRPQSDQESLTIKWYDKVDGVTYVTLENTSDEEAVVILPVYDYGNYYAQDTEGTRFPLETTENSLLQFTVPAGYTGAIAIKYKEPILWRGAELVSLVTGIGLVCGAWRGRKKEQL